MSGKMRKTKKENQDTEKTARNNIAKIVHVAEMVNSLKDYLDAFTDNPFFIKCNNNIVKFEINLNRFIVLPYNISKIIFGDIVEIRELNVSCSDIKLGYAYVDNTVKVYTIELNDTMIRIKDLFLLLYVMDRMDSGDLNVFINNLNAIQDSIETARSYIRNLLQSNGIETHG
jgi:hypothetical protein